jgi:hypothetical protein
MRFVNAARGFLLAIPLAMLALSACQRYRESYAPPEQRAAIDDPERWERIVHMTDVDAPDHFIADISDPLAGNWRWTGKRPMVQLGVPADANVKYHIEFAIPQETFRSTGPVTLTFLVNGRALDARHYEAAGSYEFEKDVPSEWILRGADVRLGAEIDKILSLNGRTYGFLLIAVGLKRN